MLANGADYHCYAPSTRSRSAEKPINSHKLLERAHKKQGQAYEKQKQRERLGLDEDNDLEIVLLKNVSRRSFMNWIKETHHGIRPSFLPRSNEDYGDIVITELPSDAHEIAAGELMSFIRDELSDISRNLRDTIRLEPGKDIKWTNGIVKIPDGGLKTLDSQHPNVVIEIAYSESSRQLRADVHNWIQLTTHVQIAIGIKIFAKNTRGQRKMIALYEDRQGMTQEIEFGIAEAPPPLQIPIAVLYQDIPQDLQGIELLNIQLIRLRNTILRELAPIS